MWNRTLDGLIVDMEKELEMIIKWLKDSGLVVNNSKTEMCLFHRNDQNQVLVNVAGSQVKTQKSMNVLGVVFDCNLNWREQVANAIKKSNKTLYAIRMIRKYFNQTELKILLNSFYYSVLYYNAEIWLTPSLQAGPKQQLLSASSNALRTCMYNYNHMISFRDIHKLFNKSTPEQFSLYKTALLLYRVFNFTIPGTDWFDLNVNIISTSRQATFDINRSNHFKIGMNTMCNKLCCIRKKIHLDYLNLPLPTYKCKVKSIF
jgi:hypothetical protein